MRTSSKWIATAALGLAVLTGNALAARPTFMIDGGPPASNEARATFAQKRIRMNGEGFSYSLAEGLASVNVQNIFNEHSTQMTGVLRLELWATPLIPDAGSRVTGVKLATFATLSALEAFSEYDAVEQSAPFQAPPPGTYTIVLALLQAGMSDCGSADGFCVVDTLVARAPETFGIANDYSDLWYNPADTGWGVSVTQRGATAFVVIYVYDEAGNPKWYVASSMAQSGEAFSGPLYETRAGEAPSEVGSATLTFAGAGSGTLAYTVRGTTSTRSIVRQVF